MNVYQHEDLITGQYNPEDIVRFRSGLLMGKEGSVVEAKGNYAVLYFEDLGPQVRVDLRKNLVERA